MDRFYEFTSGRRAGARRLVVLAPESARFQFDAAWIADAEEYCDMVWSEELKESLSVETLRR